MESITIGELAKALTLIVGLIGSITYIKNGTVKSMTKVIDNRLEPIKEEIEVLKCETNKNNLSSIKTDLINLMELADKGTISEEQKIRLHELYDYYHKHGGNSYVHNKWERLLKENKL